MRRSRASVEAVALYSSHAAARSSATGSAPERADVSGSRMAPLIYGPQAFVGHVRIDLGSPKTLMAEQFLHGSQVCPTVEQVRRERVPECVRTHGARAGRGVCAHNRVHAP